MALAKRIEASGDENGMIRDGSTLGLGRIVSGDAGRIDSGADRPVSIQTSPRRDTCTPLRKRPRLQDIR